MPKNVVIADIETAFTDGVSRTEKFHLYLLSMKNALGETIVETTVNYMMPFEEYLQTQPNENSHRVILKLYGKKWEGNQMPGKTWEEIAHDIETYIQVGYVRAFPSNR
jgi:hypothetical protein